MSITQKPANPNNYSQGRFGHQLNLVIIHTMQGFLPGTDSWFANPSSHVSAHYGIGLGGEVHQNVQDQDTAWAAGNWEYNCRSINIEFEDDNNPQGVVRPDAQYNSGAQLIANLCRTYGIPCDRAHIIGHREVPGNDHPLCPGNEDIDRLVGEAATLLATPVVTPAVAHPQPPRGTVKVTAQPFLNLRTEPTSQSPLATGYDGNGNPITHMPPGAEVQYVDVVQGELVAGNNTWLKSVRGHWFWAGGTDYKRGNARFLGRLLKRA